MAGFQKSISELLTHLEAQTVGIFSMQGMCMVFLSSLLADELLHHKAPNWSRVLQQGFQMGVIVTQAVMGAAARTGLILHVFQS